MLSPSGGSMFDRSLLIRVAARDGTSPLGRISLYGNGRKVRSFTKDLKNGRAVQIDWQGARRLPYGPVTLTVVALDEFGNTTRRDVVVRRVNPATLPPQATTFRLRVSGRGLRRTVRGSLRAPGFAFRPGGGRFPSSPGSTGAATAGSRCTSAARTRTARSATASACASPGAGGSSPLTPATSRSAPPARAACRSAPASDKRM